MARRVAALRELRWFSRDGQPAGSTSEPIDAWDLRIAPDGRRIVTTEVDRQFRTLDVLIRNGAQPAPMRLSLSADVDKSGVWSPDGLRIAWAGQRRKVLIRGGGAVLPRADDRRASMHRCKCGTGRAMADRC